MDKEGTPKKRRCHSEEQEEKDAAGSSKKRRNTRSITLDMSKYSSDIKRLTESELVEIFNFGVTVKQSFTLTFSENNEVFKKELKSLMEKMGDVQTSQTQVVLRGVEYSEISVLDRIDKFKEELDKLTQQMYKPAIKGSVGEKRVITILKKSIPNYTFTDVSKQAGAGDISVKTPNEHNFLIEVKTYAKAVPKPAIEKFKRDVASSHDVKVGIMFSLDSGIATKSKEGKFEVEFDNEKVLIYVPNALVQEEIMVWSVLLANELVGMDVELKHGQAKELQKLFGNFQEKVKEVKKCRDKIKALKDAVEDLENNVEPILKTIEKAKKAINDIMKSMKNA